MQANELKNRNFGRENITVDFTKLRIDDGHPICPECEVGKLDIQTDASGCPLSAVRCTLCGQSFEIANMVTTDPNAIVINITNEMLHGILYRELVNGGVLGANQHYTTSLVYQMSQDSKQIMGITFYAKSAEEQL